MNGRGKDQQYIYLLFLDIGCLMVSFLLAAWIRYGFPLESWFAETYGFALVIVLLSYGCIYFVTNSEKKIFKRGFFDEFVCVFQNNLLLSLLITGILFFLQKGQIYSRAFFACLFFCNVCLDYIVRQYYKIILLSYYKKSGSSNKVIIITTFSQANDIIKKMQNEKIWDYLITGIAIIDRNMTGDYIAGIEVVADIDTVSEVVTKKVVDEIFISLNFKENIPVNLDEMILEYENMGIIVNLNISAFVVSVKEKTVKNFGGYNVVSFSTKVFDWRSMALKRMMDVAGSLIGIAVTLFVGIFVTIAIFIESPGPIIFSQIRVGKNGRRFKIYKFRSMYSDAEERKKELLDQNEMEGLMFKMTDDPRVTKVGKFIRKTSVDELPQFFNVLKGDMSLVGTRPPTEEEFLQYEGRHKRRLALRPGITGLWQVSGRSDIENFEDVVKMDLDYIDNWSLTTDIKLLMKTVWVVVFRIGAK